MFLVPTNVVSMQARVLVKSKKGIITQVKISTSPDPQITLAQEQHFKGLLKYRVLHEIRDFHEVLSPTSDGSGREKIPIIATWLNSMFGK